MSKRKGAISPVSLQEMYIHPGEYGAKFIIDPRKSSQIEIKEILVLDADGLPLVASSKRWGTKLHLSFTIAPETPDGVALIDFKFHDGKRERFGFWVVK